MELAVGLLGVLRIVKHAEGMAIRIGQYIPGLCSVLTDVEACGSEFKCQRNCLPMIHGTKIEVERAVGVD